MVSLAAPANAKSFTIQRSAGTSTRISQVCFEVKNTESAIDAVTADGLQVTGARKMLQNGQILILRGDKTYNALGAEVK